MPNLGKASDERSGMRPALLAAALILVADQASKWAILAVVMDPPRVIEVTPFFNLTLGFNRGVTFGLLGDSNAGPWLLAAVALAVVATLAVWVRHTGSRVEGAAIGAIMGGGLGNVIDRVRQGTVTDFLDLHAFGWHWPTFNVADVAIVCGVGALLLHSGLGHRRVGAPSLNAQTSGGATDGRGRHDHT
ncbi:signal peptidase II [Inquilinus sp. CAU 1745]|uniref:signal peptidase II n=1 Tax=Inquilinus sp. CAU 1745 TaxID=3140369 RepID=UPI00325B055A